MNVPISAENMAAFNKIANTASDAVTEVIIANAETHGLANGGAAAGTVYYASITGAVTAALRVLDATITSGALSDGTEAFRRLMLQAADTWGQIAGQPQGGGTVQ